MLTGPTKGKKTIRNHKPFLRMKKQLLVVIPLLAVIFVVSIMTHHTAPKQVQLPSQAYVALGDSVAAGVGLKYDSDSSACDRTDQSYSHIVAARLNLKLTNISCSGATIGAGISGQQNVNNLLATPQIDQLFTQPKPQVVSLTIGANDIDWTSIITKCYVGVCGSDDDTSAVNAHLNVLTTNMSDVLSKIGDHYGKNVPKVIVTGYHQVFPSSAANCADLTGIDANELAWGRQQQANLNTTIQAVVQKYHFAVFVPINFTGHELCTTDSWVQGIGDKQPYHPTAAGQIEYANEIVSAVKAFK